MKIHNREELLFTPSQSRMIISGWGEDTLAKSHVEKFYYTSDGYKIKGYLALPAGTEVPRHGFPCIIWNRGGYARQGEIDDFTARGIFGQLASWGYIVLASQYRGSTYSEGHDEFGGNDISDILNLLEVATDIPEADTETWGIEGWSRGGMMTYLALTRTDIFKAAIVSGGIANLRCNSENSPFMKILYEKAFGIDKSNFKEKCMERSIVNFADRLSRQTPLLLLHGTSDSRVSPKDSLELSDKLLHYQIPFRLVLLEGGDHFLKTHRRETDQMRRKWFDKYLKNK